MKARQIALLLLLTVIGALSAPQAMAQFRGGFPGGGGMRGGGTGRDGGADSTRNQRPTAQPLAPNPTAVILEEFYEDLKLTPAQEPAWQAYMDKIQALASDLARERGRAQSVALAGAQLNALQQIERSLDSARNHLAGLEDIADAAKILYERLTPDQKLVADSRLAKIIPNAAAEWAENPPGQMRRKRNSQ